MSQTLLSIDLFIYRHSDKLAHALAGNIVATFGMIGGLPFGHPMAGSIVPTVIAGAVKEFYDKRKGGRFDPLDFAFTVLGGSTVWLTIALFRP